MKELKRTITREEVYGYEAYDGTTFKTEQECVNYEETAEAVINKRFNDLIIETHNEYQLFNNGYGSDEYNYKVFKINNENDLVSAEMFLNHYNIDANLKIGEIYTYGNFEWESKDYGYVNTLSSLLGNIAPLVKTLASYDKDTVIIYLSDLIKEVGKIDTENENKQLTS